MRNSYNIVDGSLEIEMKRDWFEIATILGILVLLAFFCNAVLSTLGA